ncbi:MAG: cold shock domain-containing protein [Reichenbachiella sp.]
MAKSQQTFNKKEKEKKRLKKRKDKQEKAEERRANSKGSELENMMMYVDEDGNLTETPPDPLKKKKVINAKTIEISVPKRDDSDVDPVKVGRVDFFDDTKGFGFIIELETQDKYFVHVNGLTEEVKEGNKVSFELEQGLKGLNAVRVKKVK